MSTHFHSKGRERFPLNSQCHNDATPVTGLDMPAYGLQLLFSPCFPTCFWSHYTHSIIKCWYSFLRTRVTKAGPVPLCCSLYPLLPSLGHPLKCPSFPESRFIGAMSVCKYIVNDPLGNISEATELFHLYFIEF